MVFVKFWSWLKLTIIIRETFWKILFHTTFQCITSWITSFTSLPLRLCFCKNLIILSVTHNGQTIFLQSSSSHSMLSFQYVMSWMTSFSVFRYFATKSQFQAFQNCFYAKMRMIEVVQNNQRNISTKCSIYIMPLFSIYDVHCQGRR